MCRVLSIVFVLLLAACGGGTTPSVSGVAHPAAGKTTLTLRVNVAASSTSTNATRRVESAGRPEYLSPSTQSLVYVISQGGTPVAGGTGYVNMTTASSYCSTSGAAQPLVCTTQIPLAITATGSYTFNVATYDQPQTANCTPGSTPSCAGNELSDQTLTTTLTVDTANTVTLALGAVATGITVSPLTPGYLQGDARQLKLWGPSAQRIAVSALDADGNVIVGPGSPAIAVTSSSATLTVSSNANQPNVFTLQAATSGSPAVVTPGNVSLTVALTAPSGGGSVPPNTTVPVAVSHSLVYVSVRSGVDVFEDGNATSTPNYTIPFGTLAAAGLAVDAAGNLYVADSFTHVVSEYSAGSTAIGSTIANAAVAPVGLAVFGSALYVADYGSDAAYEYVAGEKELTISDGISGPFGLAVDLQGTLYVTNGGNGTVTEYPAGSTTPSVTIPIGSSDELGGIAVNALGTVYVADESSNSVYEYPAGSTTAATTITSGIDNPGGIAVDAAGTLYVANNDLSTPADSALTEYPSGSTAPATTIALDTPTFVAVVPAAVP